MNRVNLTFLTLTSVIFHPGNATDPFAATDPLKEQLGPKFFHPLLVDTKIMRGETVPGINQDIIDTLASLIKTKDIEAIKVLLQPLIKERNAEAVAALGTIMMVHLDCDSAIPVDQMESVKKFQDGLAYLFSAAYYHLHPEAMINLASTMQTIETGLGVEKYSATKSLLSNAVVRYVKATNDTEIPYTLGLFYKKHGEANLSQLYFKLAVCHYKKDSNHEGTAPLKVAS
jgi:hypothetical protein